MTSRENEHSNEPEMAELDSEFGPVMGLLRDGPHNIEPVKPSPDLWSKIAHEVSAGQELAASGAAHDGEASVASLDDARQRRWGKPAAIITAVAAAILLVAVPVGLSLGSDDPTDVLLASGELDVLDSAADQSAAVELYDTDGNLWLDLETSRTAAEGEFLELWLIEPDENGDVAALVSLGAIDGPGAYDIPDDVDLDRYSVVDISVEPDDGDPEHSGDSIHRGTVTL